MITDKNYKLIKTNNIPIKAWVKGVELAENAKEQLKNLASMPFAFKHISAMPDVHWGIGATVGSVIATKGAVIPAAVGVDIGCGMVAVKTNLTANDLPDNLAPIRSEIERVCPHGRTNNGRSGDRGAWNNTPDYILEAWKPFAKRYEQILEKHPKAKGYNTYNHLGTLGTGNHFIEICLDEYQDVWIMLHSGSRGLGNKLGMYFIEKAKEEMRRWFINLPDEDLAYLVEGSDLYNDYIEAMHFAQEFASLNRSLMLEAIINVLRKKFFPKIETLDTAINCHHNYIEKEHHFGENVYITRKGAVRARKTDLGIIPASMGAKSFIVRGKGNVDSFCSCSHGAGRVMSRGEAKKNITIEQHIKDTEGVECKKDQSVLDESPKAYKDIDKVMLAQQDLVEVLYELKQVICVKG